MAKKKSEDDKTPNKQALIFKQDSLQSWEVSKPLAKNMVVLGIDPGLVNVAVCVLDSDKLVITSKIELPKFSTIGARVRYVEAVIQQWFNAYLPNLIVKEGSSFQTFGQCDSGRVQYALERVAIETNTPLITLAPTTMRAFLGVAGKGKTKADTKLQIYKKYGIETPSEDESDAVGLAFCGLAIAKGEYVITKAVKKSRKKKEKVLD